MAQPSDENLLRAHRQGDPTAFETLVRRYGDRLLGYLVRMSRNHQQAEDYFQETFRRVHEKSDTFQGRSGFKSWLFKIATNVAIDGIRKNNREPQMSSIDAIGEDCDSPQASTATLAAFIGAGGLGEPIVTGLALNDTSLILEGAVPAAALAILTELFFEAVERFAIPRHLREEPAR